MDAHTRRLFDKQLEQVLAEMPPLVHQLLGASAALRRGLPFRRSDERNGSAISRRFVRAVYRNTHRREKQYQHSGQLPDVVTIYREGIWSLAADDHGHVTPKQLRHDIRITILHELAHYHGLTEEELEDLGYG